MTANGWRAELWRRVRWHFLLKNAGITVFMCIFFAAYFHLLRHPASPVTVMPLTAVDRAVGFQSLAIIPYLTLWFYVGIPPGLMLSLREALIYGFWMAGLCLAGLTVFYLWPSAVPPRLLPEDAARHVGYALLRGVDAAGNACPSLHVATAAFTVVWVQRALRAVAAPRWMHVVNWLWLVAIVWSTMATRQHVSLDVAGGLLLALGFVLPSLHWRTRSFG